MTLTPSGVTRSPAVNLLSEAPQEPLTRRSWRYRRRVMPMFEVGDRVAVRGEPERCGTVKNVTEEVGDTASYQISWDDNVVGSRAEHELMPCPGSHTAQRSS